MSGPPSALLPWVAALTAYDVDLGAAGVHRGLPSTTVTLVLACDEPLDVGWARAPGGRTAGWSSLAGLHTGPAEIHHDGTQRGVQLALTTRGARALLGVPASDLAGELLHLDDLDLRRGPGAPLAALPERLAGTPHRRRADLVARVLADALARHGDPGPRAEVARALARLTRGAAVQQVADEIGYSRRRLSTLVREETGLAPQQLRRVARFERARRLLGRRPLAEVSQACGYADQAHLSRDWHDLAGCTPTTWLREEFPFVQDTGGDEG